MNVPLSTSTRAQGRRSKISVQASDVGLGAIATLSARGHVVCLAPQNYYEYGVVATRPAELKGLGLSISQAAQGVEKFDRDFEVLF